MKAISKKNIDGIIFDLGSTLLEYETIPWNELSVMCLRAACDFLKNRGFDLPSPEIVEGLHFDIWRRHREQSAATLVEWKAVDALGELLKNLGLDGGEDSTAAFFDAFYSPIAGQLTSFADAHRVLAEVKRMNKTVGLVSNTIFPEEYHLAELRKFGLLRFFDFTIFSSTFGFRKPHPSIYQNAVRASGTGPERLLFVGDRYIEDWLGPRQNGFNAVLKYREGREYPSPLPEDLIFIKSLSELLILLDGAIDD
jgi:putative hydrolase of the HAD superfamily